MPAQVTGYLHLAILCVATIIKHYGYKAVLDPLIADLKLLETCGFTIGCHQSTHHFFGTMSMLVADNLAARAIGGYYQNFSTVQRFSRFCIRIKDSIMDHSCDDYICMADEYDAQVTEVEKAPELSSLYGIKERSVLKAYLFSHL